MTLLDREKMIYYMVTISHSRFGKSVSYETKQQILKYLRDTTCQSITDEQWHQIAMDVKQAESEALSTMMTGMLTALGGKINIGELLSGKTTPEQIKQLEDIEEKTLASLSNNKTSPKLLEELEKNLPEKDKIKFMDELKKQLKKYRS